MKIRIIALVYLFSAFSLCLADGYPGLKAGLSTSGVCMLSGYYSRDIKIQPGFLIQGNFIADFNDIFSIGFNTAYIKLFSSNLDGGWCYCGFGGFEAGFDCRFTMPFWDRLNFGIILDTGWYHYSQSKNYFFLPSVGICPSILCYTIKNIDFFVESPVKYYISKNADILLSFSIQLRTLIEWK